MFNHKNENETKREKFKEKATRQNPSRALSSVRIGKIKPAILFSSRLLNRRSVLFSKSVYSFDKTLADDHIFSVILEFCEVRIFRIFGKILHCADISALVQLRVDL